MYLFGSIHGALNIPRSTKRGSIRISIKCLLLPRGHFLIFIMMFVSMFVMVLLLLFVVVSVIMGRVFVFVFVFVIVAVIFSGFLKRVAYDIIRSE